MKYEFYYIYETLSSATYWRLSGYKLTRAQIKRYAKRETARVAASMEYLDEWSAWDLIVDLDDLE